MPKIIIDYKWRYYDEARRKYFTTRHWTSEERIRIEHPDAVMVPGSKRIIEVPDDPFANSFAHFYVGFNKDR